jgi:hypothetical protein
VNPLRWRPHRRTVDPGWCLARGLLSAVDVPRSAEPTNEICRRVAKHVDDLTELLTGPGALLPEGLLPGVR